MASLAAAVYLGLGANVGDRLANLRLALARLQTLARLEEVSSLYETQPQGVSDQPLFLNAVCRVSTGLEPQALLRFLKNLEQEIGRVTGIIGTGRRVVQLHWGGGTPNFLKNNQIFRTKRSGLTLTDRRCCHLRTLMTVTFDTSFTNN